MRHDPVGLVVMVFCVVGALCGSLLLLSRSYREREMQQSHRFDGLVTAPTDPGADYSVCFVRQDVTWERVDGGVRGYIKCVTMDGRVIKCP